MDLVWFTRIAYESVILSIRVSPPFIAVSVFDARCTRGSVMPGGYRVLGSDEKLRYFYAIRAYGYFSQGCYCSHGILSNTVVVKTDIS